VASLPYLALFHGDLAFDGLADAALASLLALCWHPWPHCAGIIANIALLSLPALCWDHCPHRAGAFALLRWHCCPCCLPVAASIANWHLPSHKAVATHAGIMASIAPTLLLALRRHHHPCCTGIFALFMLASLPSSHLRCHQHHKLASAQS
jgi:hypothetical protein